MAYVCPDFVASRQALDRQRGEPAMPAGYLARKTLPIVVLIAVVLGGIYAGLYTPTEAGAAGAFVAFLFALGRRQLTLPRLWDVLVETGHITATLLFLIVGASMYSRMLGLSGLPTEIGKAIGELQAGLVAVLVLYVIVLLILGTIIDSLPHNMRH